MESQPRPPLSPPTRLEIVWSARRAVLAFAVLVAAAAGVVAAVLPTTYSATATIWVALPESRAVPRDSVLAANDLAAQYAQLASSLPVLRAAEAKLPTGTALAGSVSAKPVNNYNLIGVSASSRSARAAATHANAVADALVAYLRGASDQQTATATAGVTTQLAQLDRQIAGVRASITAQQRTAQAGGAAGAAAQATLPGAQTLLASLLAQRQTTINSTVGDVTGAQPTISTVNQPADGGRQGLSPTVIGGLALLVALVVGAEGAVLARQLRGGRRLGRPGSRRDTGLRWQRRSVADGRPADPGGSRPADPGGSPGTAHTNGATPPHVGASATRGS